MRHGVSALFEFNQEQFADSWHDAMIAIRGDRYTLFYVLFDGDYQWQSVMLFPSRTAEPRRMHDFYKQHGDVIQKVRNSVVHNVLQFRTNPTLFTGFDGERP